MNAGAPTAEDAAIYMEICAALIKMSGQDEVAIPGDMVPMSHFSIWRRVEAGQLIVRLVVDDKNPNRST